MYILGINGGVRLGYQDISAVLIKDGEVIAAVEEERLNRIKFSPGQISEKSIQSVLNIAKISIHDVDVVCSHGSTWGDAYANILKSYFKNSFGYCPPIEFVHHHDAHAASAFYASGFGEALVVTIDGSGDGISTQLAIGNHSGLKVEKRFSRPASLGIFYSLVTQFCGYVRDSDEYKLMGLSSYGDRNKHDFNWLMPFGGGEYQLDEKYLLPILPGAPSPTRQQILFSAEVNKMLGDKRMKHDKMSQKYMDIAASAQHHFEGVLIDLVTEFHKRTGISRLCLAGGSALNCVANQKLMNLPFIDEIFVQPASSDAGISLGAAYLASAKHGDSPKPHKNVYLGPEYSDVEIERLFKIIKVKYRKTDNPARYAAEKVAEGKIVAWFQGRMEFGPRALGARSILANPCLPEMKDHLNRSIKFRESFRPFCPSVLEEDYDKYFIGKNPVSPYMTITYDVKPEAVGKIPAVTHVDNTARIQTVNKEQNPLFYQYLLELKKLTGHGVSINTSFNTNDEPIVCSPLDAIASFSKSGMDCLVIGGWVVEK